MIGLRRHLAGRYRLDRTLSTDPSGTVYLAKDLRSGAKVTVKELAAGLVSDRAYMERLRDSAAALTSFDDPNFVSVLDVVEAGGRAYVVSVFVEGQTLREVMGSTPIPPAEALALLRGSLLGLAAVNSAGLVHRSVRPESVVLLPDGQVKVTGFDQPAYAGATAGSEAVPPPGVSPYAYIAPEQVVGGAADARTDVYLAGLLGFELLAGSPAFTAPEPSQLMSMHLAQDPPQLSTMHPEIPASVAEIVTQALAKEPDDRQQGARSFIAQIDAAGPSLGPAWALAMVPGSLASLLVPAAAPQPVAPTPVPRRVPVRPVPSLGWRRRGALVPGAAALSLALTGGAAFAYSQRWLGSGGGQVPAAPGASFTASTGLHAGGVPGGLHPYLVPPPGNPPAETPPASAPLSPTGPGGSGAVAVIPVVTRVPPALVQVPPTTVDVVTPPPVTAPPPPTVAVPQQPAVGTDSDHDGDEQEGEHHGDNGEDKGHDGHGDEGHHDGGQGQNGEHRESD